jgi:pimeloyl-ACP methyl ester carboxylesterase
MHHQVDINGFPGSYGLMAEAVATRALVFVHGFCGDAVDTWNHFQALVGREPFAADFQSTDLFFYDYPCTRYTIAESADALNGYITAAAASRPFAYESMRLIGHSTGAVVIRRLLLDLARGAAPSPHRPLMLAAQPLLFSSAQFGFRHALAVGLFAQSVPFLAAAASIWQMLRGRVYADLDPTSPVLAQLAQQTVNRVNVHGDNGLRALLYWGAQDNIVNVVDYEVDTRVAFEPDSDHTSVCKPSAAKPRPVEWVINAVR